jgi:hypothetical protein
MVAPNPEMEKQFLHERADFLQTQLDAIQRRLNDLAR